MFANFNKTRLSRSQSAQQQRTVSSSNEALIADIQAGMVAHSQDDVFNGGEKKTNEFGDN